MAGIPEKRKRERLNTLALNIKVKVKEKDSNEESTVKKEVFIPEIKPADNEIKKEVFMPRETYAPEEKAGEKEVFMPYQQESTDEVFSQPEEEIIEDTDENKVFTDKSKKNIIFYFTDQQRWDTFNEDIMPNLMSLAMEGVTFDNCFTCQPVCGPARACLQSGMYATETGCFKNDIALPEETHTLADCFNSAGYETAYIGKWHLASDKDNDHKKTPIPKERLGGYQYFRGADVLEFTSDSKGGYVFDEKGNQIDFEGYRADCINDFALEYIDNYSSENPFFMFISQLEPHHQNSSRHFEGYPDTVEYFRDYPIPEELTYFRGNYEKEYADYLSAVNRLDYNLGRLVEKLKEKGIYEDTVIVFTSDHGCHFRTRNAEYKRSCHDSSTHIPLVIRGGEYIGGLIDRRLVSLIDLPATVLSMAGITAPGNFKGIDLAGEKKRDEVYIQISESQCARAIRTEQYLYSVSVPGYIAGMSAKSSPVYTEEYLYDIENDPMQLHNLIRNPEYKIVRSALKKVLLEQMKYAEGAKAVILPAIAEKKK